MAWILMHVTKGYVYQDAFGDLGYGRTLDAKSSCLLRFNTSADAERYSDWNALEAVPVLRDCTNSPKNP